MRQYVLAHISFHLSYKYRSLISKTIQHKSTLMYQKPTKTKKIDTLSDKMATPKAYYNEQ